MKRHAGGTATVAAGFTLVEVIVSIGLMSLVAAYFVYDRIEELKYKAAENIAQEVLSIGNKAIEYYGATLPGAWPDNDGATPNCQDPVQQLITQGFLPSGYAPLATAEISFDCSAIVAGMSNAFRIQLRFANADRDIADIAHGMLPAAQFDETSSPGNVLIQYVITPPRRLGNQYGFEVVDWDHGHDIVVSKPHCGAGYTPQYIATPQSLCITDSNGLGGYYFADSSTTSANWELRLMVASGDDTSPELDPDGVVTDPAHWEEMDDRCNGQQVRVGVITFCD